MTKLNTGLRVSNAYESLATKLDLTDHLASCAAFLARPKSLILEGDIHVHFRFVEELSNCDMGEPPSLPSLDKEIAFLAKSGVCGLDQLSLFVTMIRYFIELKKRTFGPKTDSWLAEITIPSEFSPFLAAFDDKGVIKPSIDIRLEKTDEAIKREKQHITRELYRIMNEPKMAPYLVDRQIHLAGGEEAMCVRGGFNHVLKADITGRTGAGFFYVVPLSISHIKDKLRELGAQKEAILYEYAKNYSSLLTKNILFCKFINRAFDRWDHYQARARFARAKDYNFLLPHKSPGVILDNFVHPAISGGKPFSIRFDKDILLITGVNAGGKTMLLKSILSSVFMTKYLIPFRIQAPTSRIGSFSGLSAVLDDPQNVKNDISTFAGRITEFSTLFSTNGEIVGIDEIELGTDSDEAASLFRIVLEKLVLRKHKLIVTTHHKRLAMLLAAHPNVQLFAAIYDEKHRMPTYTFLEGSIGKSYAFETAERYGIPHGVVVEARMAHGEDKERLNAIIERSSQLEMELTFKKQEMEEAIRKLKNERDGLQDDRIRLAHDYEERKNRLEKEFRTLINEGRDVVKQHDPKEIHRFLNRAHEEQKKLVADKPTPPPLPEFVIGDFVHYGSTKGIIRSFQGLLAVIESEGRILKVHKEKLVKKGGSAPVKKERVAINFEKPRTALASLDLHGLYSEEAIETLDRFLSDSLIAGYDELLVYHGIGSGKLAFAVREFLKAHPSVKGFSDAPANMGGMGAKLIRL